ncbi:MAG: hypothetical protein GY722_19770 [bacterium]|nr:hypothetical protein [bacterium]
MFDDPHGGLAVLAPVALGELGVAVDLTLASVGDYAKMQGSTEVAWSVGRLW